MKKLLVVILLGLLAVMLSGCGRGRWNVKLPPGYTQADYERDVRDCKQYTRKWCSQHGSTTTTAQKEGKQGTFSMSRTECTSAQQEEVYYDCLRGKGYTVEFVKK
jgi:hypothetical protein